MSIIRGATKDNHVIKSFVFENLDSSHLEKSSDEDFQPLSITPAKTDSFISTPKNHSVETVDDLSKRDSLINSLLEKTDNLTSELIKVQNQLSEQDKMFKTEMVNVKETSFQQGIQAGILEAKNEVENQYGGQISQLSTSIQKLEDLSSQVSSMMDSVEKELVHTSIEIAKEVIESEISFNSGQVAINLAKGLIKKLDDAKEISIRVNLNDYESLKQGLSNLSNIEIIPDDAIMKGGVIIISEVGSIEGNIMERFKKIKSSSISKIHG